MSPYRYVPFPSRSRPIPATCGRCVLALCSLLQDKYTDSSSSATIPSFLSARDCASLVTLFSQQGLLQPPRPPGKDEAARTNWRWQGEDQAFADTLRKHCEALVGELEGDKGTRAKAMNPNIRVYRYEQGQSFGKHYDDSIFANGMRSKWYE